MRNLLNLILNTILFRFRAIFSRLKAFTNPTYLKMNVFGKIQQFFMRLLDVKPKDKDDYYGFGRWLVSKKLVAAIVIILGTLGIIYIVLFNPPTAFLSSGDGIRTYRFDALPLRFAKGEVRILANSNYLAYQGTVEGGKAEGKGNLYRKDGTRVYIGDFASNRFNGKGTLFYPSEETHYIGEFDDNLFEGDGTLYREDGSLEYEGEFSRGLKHGSGKLFNESNSPIFTGNWNLDYLRYQDMVGLSTKQLSTAYTGSSRIYLDDTYFAVYMQELNALYYGFGENDTVQGDVRVTGVYVMDDTFVYQGKEYNNLNAVQELFANPVEYEGDTAIILPEAVCIHEMNKERNTFFGDVEANWNALYDNVIQVESLNTDYTLYLYAFVDGTVRYTFYCSDQSGRFEMYSIETQFQ